MNLPYNLSAQFSQPNSEIFFNGKRPPKTRNKKIKEKLVYDILQLDEQIKICFIQEKSKIPEYKKRIVSMTKTLFNMTIPSGIDDNIVKDIKTLINVYNKESVISNIKPVMTYRQFLTFYDQIKRLIERTNNIESESLYRLYILLTKDIVNEYKNILSVPIKTAFLCKIKPKSGNNDKKSNLLDRYLKIVSNFIDIEYEQEPVNCEVKYSCKCGNSTEFEHKDGQMSCEQCGDVTPIVSAQTSFKDIERVNLHQKYKYEKRSHFKEGIYQFQGKQNKYIDPSVYTRANDWLIIHNLLDLTASVDDKKKRYIGVTKDHLRLFLSESNDEELTKHYEDLHLIYSELTDKPCPDISYLEEKLYFQFDKLVEAFLSMGDEIERTNILNSSFVLRKLLLMNNYIPDPLDFPGLKTASRQSEHEMLFQILCQKAGLNHPDAIASVREIPKTDHNRIY